MIKQELAYVLIDEVGFTKIVSEGPKQRKPTKIFFDPYDYSKGENLDHHFAICHAVYQ
jgi:hypothetical protein